MRQRYDSLVNSHVSMPCDSKCGAERSKGWFNRKERHHARGRGLVNRKAR